MKALIVGGAGFIGCNLADELAGAGNEVTVLDNLSRRGTKENLEWLKERHGKKIGFIKADIRKDTKKLDNAARNSDSIYHLAAQVAVTTSVENPRNDFETNALGTFNVCEAARKAKSNPSLIYSSTNKVYGGMEKIRIDKKDKRYYYRDFPEGISEEMCLDFHSPYGCSKGCGDQYVRDYARIYGVNSTVFRQSCIYGERQFGVEDQGWIAWFTIRCVLGKPVTIYGDGMQVRDVLYIKDLVDAFKKATRKKAASKGKIFNIGGGQKNTLSLLELVDFLELISGRKMSVKFGDWRPGDQPVYVSDISKARRELGWKPLVEPRKGVRNLYEWVLHNQNLFSWVK